MKNLTKIFMAVAVALFAFSCVADATEDLGVKVGGQTELTLSIEESRTQLGEKAGDVYPVTWCEGDVVAVNGVASTGIEIVGNGTSATFTFPEAIARPWSVVYPATTATPVTEGLQAVTFLATQEYKAGTFCDGAAPMYGVAAAAAEGEEAPAVQLNHLTGVLRLAVKGNGEVLTGIAVTAETGKIAGNFDVDCATGALTAHEDATNVVTVTFGEGLTLGEEATPIYVAVPAGEYGGINLVLTTADTKKMTIFFNSDGNRAIKAATVREFKEFVFAENDVESDWFEIYTVADMLTFAKNAANFPFVGAKLMATIDMSEIEWTPIDGFGKVFDGGKDQGHEIKGLKAPLFNSVAGTIKNLKLSVDIEVATISGPYAPLVCAFSGTMSDCEVLGEISVTGLNNNSHYPVSGVIGRTIEDATIDNVVNRCNVTVVHNNTGSNSGIGSILGQAQVATNKCVIKNSTNYGAVSISGKSRALYHGGIVGRCDSAIEIIKTTNNGSLTIDISSARDFHIGGFVGSTGKAVTITDCTNNAAITVSGNGYNDAHMGGFIGYASSAACNITGSTNTGAINVSTHHKSHLAVAGFFGYASTATATPSNLSGCINRGNITVSGMAGDATTAGTEGADGTTPTSESVLFVAGVAARINHSINISNCDNYGTLTINPVDETNLAIENADIIMLSGIVTFNDDEWNASRNTAPNDLVNYGSLNFNGSTVSYVYMGGVSAQLATISIGANNFTNYGALNIAGTIGTGLYAGGVAGVVAKTPVENFHNKATGENAMNITSTVVEKAHCGGVIGQANGSSSLKTLSNSSAVNYSAYFSTGISGKANQYEQSPAVGGVIGVAVGGSSSLGTAENLTNTGIVTIKDTKKSKVGYHHFGGVAGFVRYYNLTNLDNNATKFEMATTAQFTKLDASGESNNQGLYIGGSIGYASGCGDIKDCDNYAELQLRANNSKHIQYVGGVAGILWVGSKTISNCHNYATGKLNFLDEYKSSRLYVGGLLGQHYSGYISGCTNNADIEFLNGNKSATQFYFGGLCGYVYSSSTPGKYTNCTNNGDIIIGPNMTDTDSRATKIGGLVGYFSRGNTSTTDMLVGCENCTNNGRIQVDGGFGVTDGSMRVGGIIGDCAGTNAIGYFANNCTQNANVVVLSETYTNVAMMMGTSRKAANGYIVKDCKIVMGKGVARSQKTETTDPIIGDDGETVIKPGETIITDVVTPITSSNFFNYLYGGTTTWESGSDYDGCSVILLLPEVPANE